MQTFIHKILIVIVLIPSFFTGVYLAHSPIQPRYHPGGPYYYSTFVGYWLPHRPSGEMSKDEVDKYTYAYYETYFNEKGLITKLIKHLNDDANRDDIQYVFEYKYENGKLTTTTVTHPDQLSAEECKPFYDKFNNKILKINGDNTIGEIGVTVSPDNCDFSARYVLTFKADFILNPSNVLPYFEGYNYTGSFHKTSEERDSAESINTEVRPVRQNAMVLPDPFSTENFQLFYEKASEFNHNPTNYFYWTYYRTGNFKLEEIPNNNVFDVIDSFPYIKQDTKASGTYGLDQNEAVKAGQIVKTINLSISE